MTRREEWTLLVIAVVLVLGPHSEVYELSWLQEATSAHPAGLIVVATAVLHVLRDRAQPREQAWRLIGAGALLWTLATSLSYIADAMPSSY